jgi:hypothetical protein
MRPGSLYVSGTIGDSAQERYFACMTVTGYGFYEVDLSNPVMRMTLKDGTLVELEPGEAAPPTRGWVEYLNDSQRCKLESGLLQVMEARGLVPNIDRAAVESINEYLTRLYSCIEERGWEIPEPVSDPNGLLHYFLDEGPPEQEEARSRDILACDGEVRSGS